jgi:hypothetical protein
MPSIFGQVFSFVKIKARFENGLIPLSYYNKAFSSNWG